MNIAVTGACGLLGSHVMAALADGHRMVGADRHPWWGDRPATVLTGDLQDAAHRSAFLAEARPDVLIHCAAMVTVDGCEAHPADAYAVNATVTRELARAVPRGCLVVYVSTDSVFKGDRPFATEHDLPCPRTVYARSKLHGEWEVQLATANHVIVRTNFYGWSSGRKSSSAEWLYGALRDAQPITLFDDFFFSPIYVTDLIDRLVALIERGERGLFHVAGRDRVSKFEFGSLMANAAGLSMARATRGSIDAAGLAAERPKEMSIASGRLGELQMDPPGCADGLRRFVSDRSRRLSERF